MLLVTKTDVRGLRRLDLTRNRLNWRLVSKKSLAFSALRLEGVKHVE